MSSEWRVVRGHLRDADPIDGDDFADAWRDPEGQALLALLREQASALPPAQEVELTLGPAASTAKRSTARALAPTALAVALLLIVLATVVHFQRRGSERDGAAAPSATASAPTLDTAPAVVSVTSQPSAAVCGYRHDEDGFRLDVASPSAIKASGPKIDGADALRLARAKYGGEAMPSPTASTFVTPVLYNQTQPGGRLPGYGAGVVGRLMYDVNVSGIHDLVSGKVGGPPIVADSAEILIDAVTGKEAFTLECGRNPTPASPHYAGPVTSNSTAAGDALKLSPPGDARPKLNWKQAYAAVCSRSQACVQNLMSATVVLARVTTPGQGEAAPDGTLRQLAADNELSYVVIWANTKSCPAHGGAVRPSGAPSASLPSTCTETQVVDANSGAPVAGDYYD